MNVPEGGQAVQGGVDPAIQGNVRRSHIPGFAAGVVVPFAERTPSGDFRITVLGVGAEDLPPDIPTQSAPHNNVRCKVLLTREPCRAYPSRHTVGEQFSHRAWVFMSNYTGNRPANSRVLRWERVTTLKKLSAAVARKRAVATEGIFKNLSVQECVNTGFSA